MIFGGFRKVDSWPENWWFLMVFDDFSVEKVAFFHSLTKKTAHPPPRRGVKTSDGIKKWSIRDFCYPEKAVFPSQEKSQFFPENDFSSPFSPGPFFESRKYTNLYSEMPKPYVLAPLASIFYYFRTVRNSKSWKCTFFSKKTGGGSVFRKFHFFDHF